MKSDSLFQLIRSLTKNEKGYFKKFISRHTAAENNDYVKLFDAIEKQDEYDEEKLKKAFSKTQIAKHLPVWKNYVYHAILKSLRSYNYASSIDSQIQDRLKDAETLFRKSLYSDCAEVLLKAKELAEKYEKHLLLLEIYFYQFKLGVMRLKDGAAFRRIAIKDHEEQLTILENYKNLLEYRQLVGKLGYFAKSEYSEDLKKNDYFTEVLNSPLLSENAKPLSYKAQTTFYSILGRIYNVFLKDAARAYEYNSRNVAFMESDPDILKQEVVSYAAALNNLGINLIELKKHAEFNRTMEKLNALPADFPNLKIRILETTLMLKLLYYIKTVKIREGIAYIEDTAGEMEKYRSRLNKDFLLAIYDSISILYFLDEQFGKSLQWVNKILNSRIELRNDVISFSQVLYLLIHYELKNMDHLEYVYERAFRFIKKHKGLNGFEWPVLQFMKKVPYISEKGELKNELLRLKTETAKFRNSINDKHIFECFDVSVWAQSKLEGKKMTVLLQNSR